MIVVMHRATRAEYEQQHEALQLNLKIIHENSEKLQMELNGNASVPFFLYSSPIQFFLTIRAQSS